ncbi:MAG: IS200/IS605 family transposase [Thermoguttaceae bacterium]
MSYISLAYHVVFRTKNSRLAIVEKHERELYAYILGFTKNTNAHLYRVGGMPDHVHLFLTIPPTIAISTFMKDLKIATSKWLRESPQFPAFDGWAEGYAAISYNQKDKEMVVNYIKNQKEHHQTTNFADELRSILNENNVVIDERYFLTD